MNVLVAAGKLGPTLPDVRGNCFDDIVTFGDDYVWRGDCGVENRS